MSAPKALSQDEINSRLKDLPGWELQGNYLEKKFKFRLFKEALDFFNKVGEVAEKLNHHPDILLYNYNKIKVSTTTFAIGGKISENDFNLAKAIEEVPRKEYVPPSKAEDK